MDYIIYLTVQYLIIIGINSVNQYEKIDNYNNLYINDKGQNTIQNTGILNNENYPDYILEQIIIIIIINGLINNLQINNKCNYDFIYDKIKLIRYYIIQQPY